jgi:hypothetical protein
MLPDNKILWNCFMCHGACPGARRRKPGLPSRMYPMHLHGSLQKAVKVLTYAVSRRSDFVAERQRFGCLMSGSVQASKE